MKRTPLVSTENAGLRKSGSSNPKPAHNAALLSALKTEVIESLAQPTSENSAKAYETAVNHYTRTWGGSLPATALELCQYLQYFGDVIGRDWERLPIVQRQEIPDPRLNPRTLGQYLSRLSHWYRDHRYHDATQEPSVRKMLTDLRAQFGRPFKKAKPLWAEEIFQISQTLWQFRDESTGGDYRSQAQYARALRDHALILFGWWRGFRSAELADLRFELITLEDVPAREGRPARQQLRVFLPTSKGDRKKEGTHYLLPSVPHDERLCPVAAYLAWRDLTVEQRNEKNPLEHDTPLRGPVFCKISKSGNLSFTPFAKQPITRTLKRVLATSGIHPENYSSHSLKRGIINEMLEAGISLDDIADHVKHDSIETTRGYKDTADRVVRQVLENKKSLAQGSTKQYFPPSIGDPQ